MLEHWAIVPGLALNLEIFGVVSSVSFSSAYNRSLSPDFILVKLGTSPHSLDFHSALQQALAFGMVVAKRLILKEWKAVVN